MISVRNLTSKRVKKYMGVFSDPQDESFIALTDPTRNKVLPLTCSCFINFCHFSFRQYVPEFSEFIPKLHNENMAIDL